MVLLSILSQRFRTGHLFHLHEWNILSLPDQESLPELSGSDAVYGIFQPACPAPHLTTKLASADAALLYFHFQKARHLPHCFSNRPAESVAKTLAHLVLDRILEVESKGQFVSGSDAIEMIYGTSVLTQKGAPTFLSLLSAEAISHAFLLRHPDVKSLAQWLYTFNTWPWDVAAKKSFTGTESVHPFLFSKCSPDAQQQLERGWQAILPKPHFSWFSWVRETTHYTGTDATFKLYISPPPQQVPDVFSKLISVLTACSAFCFKVGATLQGLLRADKLVAYFADRNDLLETAAVLTGELAANSVHGVPFTCQLDQRGMLSWGVDPPANEVLQGVEGGSWRTNVTAQLAVSILQAKEEKLNPEQALSFVKAKLQTAGIDMNDWTANEV